MTAALRGYRIVKKKHQATCFSGEGTRLYGGRWNSRGKRCTYLAASESLAVLEVMVHVADYRLLKHYVLFELPLHAADIRYVPDDLLPRGWANDPAPPQTAALGDGWLDSGDSVALSVPSAVIPRERNYVLNVDHDDYERVIDGARLLAFTPDPRLAK
ncbi:MAG: RES family NAD+ phosphorylase [Pseudomonadales bacterium]